MAEPWMPADDGGTFLERETSEGTVSESHLCIDCGVKTHPSAPTRAEVDAAMERHRVLGLPADAPLFETVYDANTECYMVRDSVWKKAGMSPTADVFALAA